MVIDGVHHAFGRPGDRSFTLFEAGDARLWAAFLTIFLSLIIFDNAIVFSRPRRIAFSHAMCYTCFWAMTAVGFCLLVGWWQSSRQAYMWMSGYTLQWMMSFDNLFVFHLIFKVYHTPDELKHRPLFLGILGQAVFTFSLLTCGEWLFHKLYFLHIVFGIFFIYVGVSAFMDDDGDDDPTQNPLIQWMQARLPFVGVYDTEGHFFIRLPLDEQGRVHIPECARVSMDTQRIPAENPQETDALLKKPGEEIAGVIDLSKVDLQGKETRLQATMLFLVVCTMEISDVIFSVDTIVAVSVQVNELFLAFSCVAFALLTLRATFFVVEVLAQMFSLMKYGIGAILAYIGVKLLIDRWYEVPHLVDLFVLIATFGGSILASAIYDSIEERSGSAEQLLSDGMDETA